MVNPVVLENCKIDSSNFQGFAFGVGLDRITMLKHGLKDIRAFFSGSINWTSKNGFGLWGLLMKFTYQWLLQHLETEKSHTNWRCFNQP